MVFYCYTLYNKYWAVYKKYRGIPKDIVNTVALGMYVGIPTY